MATLIQFSDESKRRLLASLHNRGTSYEVVLQSPVGDIFHVGYTRRSTRGIFDLIWKFGADVAATVGDPGCRMFRIPGAPQSVGLSSGWVAKFTGRTMRDVILEGKYQPLTSAESVGAA